MKHANFQLALLLYDISGWQPETFTLDDAGNKTWLYDLGFLLDRLPGHYVSIDKEVVEDSAPEVWTAAYRAEIYTKGYVESADNPEDAVAQLAIALLRAQVITPS
ncbi:MAG: hypothetical protein JWO63_2213 [Frankiales bacterium]|jgi:hypothetical protein|nr:hypothetical protein [Frankiales bacterium]